MLVPSTGSCDVMVKVHSKVKDVLIRDVVSHYRSDLSSEEQTADPFAGCLPGRPVMKKSFMASHR